MRYAALMSGCAALILAGCANETYHVNSQIGQTPGLLTTADLRLVTDRPVPNALDEPARRTVCTEPPPDVAKALSTALQLALKANVPSGAGGNASFGSQSAEQAMELAGRVPGVVALRDIAYRLCEGWSNGTFGDSAYALGLGRYGEVLVTLILADDVAAANRSKPSTLSASPPPPLNGNGSDGGTSDQSSPSTPKPMGPKVAQVGEHTLAEVQLASLTGQPLLAAIANPAPAQPDAKEPASNPPAKKTTGSGSAPDPTTPGTGGGADTGGIVAAQALEKMQHNYLKLGATGPLIVACIAAHDHTTPNLKDNDVLTTEFCQEVIRAYIATLGPEAPATPGVRKASTAGTQKH